MANEPRALSEILAGLPDEADFDAACAALMATERGREFLAEYARRNRHADTETIIGALARVEAAIGGEPVPQLAPAEIASEIESIAVALGEGHAVDDISAAMERIQDVAFMLHERPVDQSLRDTFDDAVRQLSDALTQSSGQVDHKQQAIARLHALATRLVPLVEIVQPTPVTNVDYQGIAEIVIAYAAPSIEKPAPEADANPDHSAAVEDQPAVESPEAEPTKIPEPAEDFSPVEENSSLAESVAQSSGGAGEVSEVSLVSPPASENALERAFNGDAFLWSAADDQSPSNFVLPSNPAPHVNGSGEPTSEQLLPSQAYPHEDLNAGPEEDPGDLFEPIPMPSPVSAPTVDEVAFSEPDLPPQRANMTEATQSVPQPAVHDPLAAVRDLSEEELIALFS
jgi:hypothetical protein